MIPLLLLIGVPLAAAALAFGFPSDRFRPGVLPLTSLIHSALVLAVLIDPPPADPGNWLVLDPLAKVFLPFTSVLFFLCAAYTARYLSLGRDHSNRMFCTCFLLSLSMITLVILSHHLGLMWVGMEATTLAMAPNIFFYRTARSLEATWKYLLLCSVGIALALLGSFFLAYSTLHAGLESTLLFDDLIHQAPHLSRPWLQAAFVLILVGYGTKMGLAPMHTWLPDAHGEAPAPVSALLSGALLPCAFLAILRVYHICNAAGDAEVCRRIMLTLGLLSMAVAAVFMAVQRDLKRLLAYSSVEHMGILMFGIAIGGTATFGSLLHVLNNGLTKVALFLSAGNIQSAYGTRLSDDIQGVIRRLPVTGSLFLAGFLAITGSPPFGPFVSEFSIISGAVSAGRLLATILFVSFLGIAFIGMGRTILPVVQGDPSERSAKNDFRDGFFTVAPILVSMGIVLILGIYIPRPLETLLREAAVFLEAKP
jgi:hydrogenase-4 component F